MTLFSLRATHITKLPSEMWSPRYSVNRPLFLAQPHFYTDNLANTKWTRIW